MGIGHIGIGAGIGNIGVVVLQFWVLPISLLEKVTFRQQQGIGRGCQGEWL